MTKLYYTDPLKAAWMMEKFHVQLRKEDDTIISTVQGAMDYCNLGRKAYVFIDSHHIFEPMEGDRFKNGKVVNVFKNGNLECLMDDTFKMFHIEKVSPNNYLLSTEDSLSTFDIEQISSNNCLLSLNNRNNTAFFMAEKEE